MNWLALIPFLGIAAIAVGYSWLLFDHLKRKGDDR